MNPRVTIALALVVALVAAYILAVDRPQAQRAEEARHLVHVTKAGVTQIALRNGKETVELARVDATHWTVTRPFRAPASSFAVSDLLDAALGIVAQRTAADKATDLAAYGLAAPATELTLRTADGKTVAVDLGKGSPVSAGMYARTVPGDAVYLIDTSARDALAKTAADLRQKTLADFTNADVQRVRVASASGTLAVDRVGPDRWRLQGAHPWPADDFKVTDLFFPITTTDAKAFHDGVTDLAPYGLDHPTVTVELTLKNRPSPLRFLFAARGRVTYAMVAPSGAGQAPSGAGQAAAPTVLQMDAGLVGRLTPTPISLVTRRVLPYDAQNLTAVTWSRDEQSLQVRRQGPGFAGGGLTEGDITDMFSSINLLEADTVEPLSAAPPGAAAFMISADGGEGARFRVAVYHRPGGWLATDAALGLQYKISANAFDSFPKPIVAFLGIPRRGPAAAPRGPVTPTAPNPVTPTAPAKPPTP
ncbi:MAG TPA: DUF4340 domain-containing protein [bacterium]|nr:DUF4340 domain-containing protein [bacterium]